MRFSLLDLLIAIALFAVSGIVMYPLAQALNLPFPGSVGFMLGALLGAALWLLLAPPIYWLLRLPPLVLPVCPRCHKRPNRYTITDHQWPRTIAMCDVCGQGVELWWRQPKSTQSPSTLPILVLRWPYSLGRWSPIADEPAA